MDQLCPPPIDWLEHLEGRSDFAAGLESHLADCPACQVLVASLKASPVPTLQTGWASDFAGRLDGVWHEERPYKPSRAEFWFSSSGYELPREIDLKQGGGFALPSFSYENVDRTLLLVIGDPEPQHGFDWIDVVPVLSDIERATETDFIFNATESSLNAPWRAMFAHQTRVARGQLDTRVGALHGLGVEALHAVLNDEVDESRWGLPIEGPYDPRVYEDASFEESLRALRTPWLLVSEAVSAAATASNVFVLRQPDRREHQAEVPREGGNILWLTRQREEPPERLAFAAASLTPNPNLWTLDAPAFRLVGRLKLNKKTGFLAFFVCEVELRHANTLRLVAQTSDAEYTSEPFVPALDSQFPIAEGVTPSAVERLGAEVVA